MTSRGPNLCDACSRRLPMRDGDRSTRCEAYPSAVGIPLAIQSGADHRQLRGDETEPLTFDQLPGDPAAAMVAEWLRYGAPAAARA